jgi:hypothetical protein
MRSRAVVDNALSLSEREKDETQRGPLQATEGVLGRFRPA